MGFSFVSVSSVSPCSQNVLWKWAKKPRHSSLQGKFLGREGELLRLNASSSCRMKCSKICLKNRSFCWKTSNRRTGLIKSKIDIPLRRYTVNIKHSFGLQFLYSLLLVSIEMTVRISSYRMVVISSTVKSVAQPLLSEGFFRDPQIIGLIAHTLPLPEESLKIWEWYGKLTTRGSHYWECLESPLILWAKSLKNLAGKRSCAHLCSPPGGFFEGRFLTSKLAVFGILQVAYWRQENYWFFICI